MLILFGGMGLEQMENKHKIYQWPNNTLFLDKWYLKKKFPLSELSPY